MTHTSLKQARCLRLDASNTIPDGEHWKSGNTGVIFDEDGKKTNTDGK